MNDRPLLGKLNLTPQKPLQRAYQRDPDAIERWQPETYPAIARHKTRLVKTMGIDRGAADAPPPARTRAGVEPRHSYEAHWRGQDAAAQG
jgi:hypothetical protein